MDLLLSWLGEGSFPPAQQVLDLPGITRWGRHCATLGFAPSCKPDHCVAATMGGGSYANTMSYLDNANNAT